MKRMLVSLLAVVIFVAGAVPASAATSVAARYQLRGHHPELGEGPALRVFVSEAAYDAYRNSLGDANVFPPASSLFMSFDRDVLALYARGNDTGGRCIATAVSATLDGDTLAASLAWQSGTCGAPLSAHYPFILMSLSRTGADGTSWVQPTRNVCASVESPDTRACGSVSGASVSPSPAASATPSPAATRTVTPTATASPASAPPTVAAASPTPSRSPVAAASPTPAPSDGSGVDPVVAGALVALGLVIIVMLMAARRPKAPPSGFRRR